MTANREPRREAIRIALAHRSGGAPGASAVAEAATVILSQMAALLTPVIGVRGVDVIFRRSLYLTSKDFPLLVPGEEHGDSAALLAGLKDRLAVRDAEDAAEAACALIATFIELLTTLIGESLTDRLMSPVWSHPSPPPEKRPDHDGVVNL
jgi:hypothetical protein